ncbi:MAG: DUF4405 domain-containing protein, partial [Clostridia bacterium]|nr:DUF4405 domain-containing protein [Clostridia bacterium]
MNSVKFKRCIDIVMTLVLFFLMAYQVTGEALHEWLGISLTALVIFHNILNRRRYRALGKGRYNLTRIILTAVDISLLLCFFCTALCGISMSSHAVPFLSGFLPPAFARNAHLALSHWSFALMGIHIGLHLPQIASGAGKKVRAVLFTLLCVCAAAGIYLLIKDNFFGYMFLQIKFAFFDYEKNS